MNVGDQLSRADEIEALAGQLLDYASDLRNQSVCEAGKFLVRAEKSDKFVDMVESILQVRRNRAKYLDHHLLGEPVWDMLLELFNARLCGQDLAVGFLCKSVGPSEATCRRWIAVLAEAGLVEQVGPGRQRQAQRVRLTDLGAMQMSDIVLDTQLMLFRAKVAYYTGAQSSG